MASNESPAATARRVTIEFAKDFLGLPWWNTSLEFSPVYDHATRTVPEWVIHRGS